MSVTGDLRAMLDERDVKYMVDDYSDYEVTEWNGPYNLWWRFTYNPYDDVPYGEVQLLDTGGATHLTPAQAIAATLGTGMLTAKQVMAIAGKHQSDYCSDTHVCFDWQAIADELNATLGDADAIRERQDDLGTCHMERDFRRWDDDLGWLTSYTCSVCGESVILMSDRKPSCCPNCGKKVVAE